MSKFCVFCGEKPEGKTKEHVIPRWLIKMTGDPKRQANFGFKKTSDGFDVRSFSFDQFTFPACNSCNNEYGKLEADVKPVIKKILNKENITVEQMSLLLDWLDKVRVGIWLGLILLDKRHTADNPMVRVEPQFHIKRRIGQFDRVLIIERFKSTKKRLSVGGVDSFAFCITPSAFTLTINNVCFTNVSAVFLASCRLGFPYPTKTFLAADRNEIGFEITNGRNRITSPILRRRLKEIGNIYIQPMFSNQLTDSQIEEYNSDYVKQHSLNFERGIGNVFEQVARDTVEYGENEIISPDYDEIFYEDDFQVRSLINIYEWQNWINQLMSPDVSDLTTVQKKFIKERFSEALKINKGLINRYKAML